MGNAQILTRSERRRGTGAAPRIEVEIVPQSPPKRVAEPGAAAIRQTSSSDHKWLRELDAQHQSLNDAMSALIDRVDRIPRADDRFDSHSQLLRLIADAELLLNAHFAFEEAGGHLSDALTVAPRLSQRAAHLQRDHRRFTASFARLATLARGMREGDGGWERFAGAIREFTQQLRLHELEENRLVQEAFLDDLGGGG